MNVNVVIVGHVDHGKSTLIGRLLYDSKTLPDDKMAEIQKLIEEYKKRFEFAYFLDSFEEELKEERTIDTTRVLFKGKGSYYTIVDVPGHKEFIKNMLTGACHAQVAILVISAPDGVQEQTRRHAFLLHMLGVKQLVVAINKMDLVGYDEDVFHEVRGSASSLLDYIGYSGVKFVPVSAIEGDNVYKSSRRITWYRGPTLVDVLDSIAPEVTSVKPLRFTVQDVYVDDSEKLVVGRVESGVLKKGEELIFQPSGVLGRVEKIRVYPGEVSIADSGDSVGIVIGSNVERGNVGGHLDTAPSSTVRFKGEVVILEGVLRRGDKLEMKCGTGRIRCQVIEIKERVSSETGEVMEENPDEIGEHEAATVVFQTEPIVVEEFSQIPELGRYVLVKDSKNIGAGIALEVNC